MINSSKRLPVICCLVFSNPIGIAIADDADGKAQVAYPGGFFPASLDGKRLRYLA